MHHLRILFLALVIPFFGNSQNGTTILGGTLTDEFASSIARNNAGDLFIGGTHEDDVLVTKLNPSGELIWAKSYNFSNIPDYLMEISITSDNFIIGCGTSRTTSNQNPTGFIFKLDTAGTLIWKRITNCNNVYMWQLGLIEAGNGNYQTCGSQNTNGHQDNYIAEFDALTGVKVWDSVYAIGNVGNGLDEVFYSIDKNPTNNASYLSGRFHSPNGQLNYHASITKIHSNGSFAWSKTFVHPFSSSGGRLYGVGLDFDNDSLVGLICGKLGATNVPFEVGIYKTDSSGIMSWGKMYSGSGNQDLRAYHIETVPSGYLITGYVNNGNKNLFVLKTDYSGNVIWANQYGSLGSEDILLAGWNNASLVVGNQMHIVGRTTGFFGGEDIILFNVDVTTGNLVNGSGCASPLGISTTILPTFEQNYPLATGPLSMIVTDPVVSTSPVVFNQTGNLIETVTDTIVSGDTLYLCPSDIVSVEADWNPSYSYLWNTGNTSQIQPITSTGWYTVDITANGCTMLTDSVYAVVNATGVNLGPDTTLCDQNGFLLDATTAGATYLWSDNSTGPTLNATTSGIHWVQVAVGGCVLEDSILVVFGNTPTVNLGNDTTICAGSTLTLDAQNSGADYLWQNASTNQTFSVGQSGQFFVEVTDGACSNSDTINVIIVPFPVVDLGNDTIVCGAFSILLDASSSVGSYLWQDGSGLSTLNATTPGIYWVEVDNGTCMSTDSIVIISTPPPLVNLGNDTTFCGPNSLLLDAQNPGAICLWQDGSTNQTFSASATGQYFVEVNLGGCIASDTINITVETTPVVDLGNDTVDCQAGTIVLDATTPGVSYLWQDGSTSSSFDASVTGTYFVTVDNGFCSATDSVNIVFGSPVIVDLGNDTTICSNSILILDVLTPNATYDWSTSSTSPSIDVVQGGVYWVTVEMNGCTDSDTILVSTLVPPSLSQGNIEFCDDESFLISLPDSPNLSYVWQDGSIGSTYTIDQSGVYTIVATNPCGVDNVQFSAEMRNCNCEIFVPNTFTPDGSEYNETFGAVTFCEVIDYKFEVFNRWGEVVFTTTDLTEQWDGMYSGARVQDGAYTWKMLYHFEGDTTPNEITGHVTIIR